VYYFYLLKIRLLSFFLSLSISQCKVGIAVESSSWISNSFSFSVQKSHSFIEIWAVLKCAHVNSFKSSIFVWNISCWSSRGSSRGTHGWHTFFPNLSNHIVDWINGSISSSWLWSMNCWLGNLLGWCDTTVTGNVVDAMFWDIVWCSGVISVNISWFPVVPWPWVEVGQWCSFNFGVQLSNHIVDWINRSISSSWLWSMNCWLSNLLGWGDTAMSGNVVDAMFWDIIWGSGVIGVNISWFPVISWPWMEVGKWGSFMLMMMFMMMLKLDSGCVAEKGCSDLIFHVI